MTCKDMFIKQLHHLLTMLLDYIPGTLVVLVVIMIMISFFGKEAKITRKTFIPLIIFLCISIGANLAVLCYDFVILRRSWNETFQDNMLTVTLKDIPVNGLRIIFYISVIAAAIQTFERNKIKNALITWVSTIALTGYFMLQTIYSTAYFFDDPRDTLYQVFNMRDYIGETISYFYEIATIIIIVVIAAAVYYGMIKKNRTMYIAKKYRFLFVLWEVSMFICIWIPFRNGLPDSTYEKYIKYELGIIMPILGLVIPMLLIAIISRHYVVEKTHTQENYIAAELDYLNQYKKDQNETRAFRHEIINNLANLSAMYSDQMYDEAGDYLSALLGDVRAMSPKYITGDEMLDCIVGMKSSKMDEEGIEFLVDGVLDGGLGMKPVDICSIFANAMDNAIEACEKLPNDSERWIKLLMKRTDKFFSITLSNTMPINEEGKLAAKLFGEGERITTKKDKAHHGFGTQNMKATISKYDGFEKVNMEDGVFTLSILIPRNGII